MSRTITKVFKIDDDRFYRGMKWSIGITNEQLTLTYERPLRTVTINEDEFEELFAGKLSLDHGGSYYSISTVDEIKEKLFGVRDE